MIRYRKYLRRAPKTGGPRPWPTWPMSKSTTGDGVLLPCFIAQSDIFAVINCCVAALSLYSSDILTWGADRCNDT